jgi:hypothetical protein
MVRSSLSADTSRTCRWGCSRSSEGVRLGDDNPDLDSLAEQMADFEWNGVRPGAR